MKKNYVTPEVIELLAFQAADVITSSLDDPAIDDWME